jgi:spore cortex formation protein SpoVR/YcgB (stage V sporulation)
MLEVIQNHVGVIYQPEYFQKFYNGINPYTLGFNMFMDMKRICENPSEEDKIWFPDIANSDWLSSVDNAMRYFKDESFIAQYLSPNMIRQLKLFLIRDQEESTELLVKAIHDEDGYRLIRETLSKQYHLSYLEPDIQIYDVNVEGDRTLTLHYYQHDKIPLDKQSHEVLKHLYTLWKFPVKLQTINQSGEAIHEIYCPQSPSPKP